jgi:hypothetical protein
MFRRAGEERLRDTNKNVPIPISLQSIDKIGNPIMFSMFGNCLFLVAFLLIGPLPFVKFEPYKTLIQVFTDYLHNCNTFLSTTQFY